MVFQPHLGAKPARDAGPAVNWEEPACPLCGERDAELYVEAPDPTPESGGLWFAVVRCRFCSLCYTSPRPDAATIGRFYPADYRPHRRRAERGLRRWYPLAALSGRPCRERRSLAVRGQGRLLDFGCGSGVFMKRMAEQGWRVTGLDNAPAAVEFVRKELKLPALAGTLPHPEVAAGSFDVVTMWHALEHVHDPLGTLRAAGEALVPGGQLFVAVPNIAGLPYRLFGRSWFGLDLPRHLTHFTPATLRAMLERAGFAVESVKMVRHGDWLRSSARLACQLAAPAPWARPLTLKPLARFAAWLCYSVGRSDSMLAVASKPH